jgi:hypothetical protein
MSRGSPLGTEVQVRPVFSVDVIETCVSWKSTDSILLYKVSECATNPMLV